MPQTSIQAPTAVIMVRPHHFTPNTQTAADNAFQSASADATAEEVAQRAFAEATGVADALRAAGVEVHLFEDESRDTPDSVFPNNWFSTHAGGHVAVYPM